MRYKERGRDKILLKRKEKTFRYERERGATERVCKTKDIQKKTKILTKE